MKNLSRNGKYFIAILGVGVMILLVFGFNSRIAEMRRLSSEADKMQEQVSSLEQTQMVLATQIAYATSDAAVEEWAYEEARMIREGDNPVAPISAEDSTPMPVPVVVSEQPSTENWKIWKALFFDPASP